MERSSFGLRKQRSGKLLALGALCGEQLLARGQPWNPLDASRAEQHTSDHVAWVGTVLGRMGTIKPGMTRADLLKVFTTEGGLSTPLARSYVSRDCLYFKVNVTFRAVDRPERDSDGRTTPVEDARDVILTISKPLLEFTVAN